MLIKCAPLPLGSFSVKMNRSYGHCDGLSGIGPQLFMIEKMTGGDP